MADNVPVTPGSGANVRSKLISGVQTQIVQIDMGGESAELQLVGDPVFGVPVYITKFPATAVLVNNPTAANLKVDASGATVPISAASAIPVSAPNSAPVAVRIANGSSAWIDTLPVSGTVTGNQGAPNGTLTSAWPIKVTDGTTVAAVDSGSGGLKVAIVAGGGGGVALADLAAFTQGTTTFNPVGALYTTSPSNPSTGQVGALQMTQLRGLHVNLRAAAGTEIGSSAAPLRIDPTGSTTQPVSGTVTANQGGAPWSQNITQFGGHAIVAAANGVPTVGLTDSTATAYSPSNVLFTAHGGRAFTRVTKSLAITASQTNSAVWTPTTGKAFYITKLILAISVTGTLTVFDGTNAAANILTDGALPVGYFPIAFDEPWASAAVNNILKYTSGSGMTGTLTAHGFEA